MNTKTLILKPILYATFMSSLLVACSVEHKSSSDLADVTPDTSAKPEKDPLMIMKPDEIVLPPSDYVLAQRRIPKEKPPLSKEKLFAGTLSAHNRIRAKHDLQPLKWSDKLAAYSQQWADQLGTGQSCKMYHRSGSPPYGENLYLSSAVIWSEGRKEVGRERNRVTIKNVVKAWTDEEQWYNYKTNSCQPGQQCGHYTQIVWRDTTEVGCAVKFCDDKSQNWVCSYNPPGNYTGKRPY